MEPCAECGLPKIVCAALTIYQKAFSAYEEGNLSEAHKSADEAEALIKQYKVERGSINRIELSDSERLRLSGYF
jgi:hypothetical protein